MGDKNPKKRPKPKKVSDKKEIAVNKTNEQDQVK